MTVIDSNGMVLKVRWSHTAKLTAEDKTINWQKTGVGRVICPDCGRNAIACVLPSTIGHNINGYCARCKKAHWMDVR